MTRLGVVKFLKYAFIVALADTLPVLLQYLNSAAGLSQVDWFSCFDASGLVFLKAMIGGSIGAMVNLVTATRANTVARKEAQHSEEERTK